MASPPPGAADRCGPVLVVVPTFRRTAWARELLDAMGDQLAGVPEARVLVLDNDPDGSALVLRGHPLVLAGRARVEHVGAGDVVSVRNAALGRARESGARALVLLDDDQLPQPGWLAALVDAAGRADVVAGPVLQAAEVTGTPHADAMLTREDRPTGPFRGDVSTANVLLGGSVLGTPGLRFHPALGRSGGEDTLFFRQVAATGASFWWAAEAVVRERVGAERRTRRALLLRAYRNGRSSVVVEELHGRPSRPPLRLLVLAAASAVHLPRAAVRAARGDRTGAWRLLYKVVRHVGRAAGTVRGGEGVPGGGYGGGPGPRGAVAGERCGETGPVDGGAPGERS